ncbi:MAG: hypothetical protein ACAH59_06595 [Pseudobdellovibrionaceae bacterium]
MKSIGLTLFLLLSSWAFASGEKKVHLEWEIIENAKSYDLEFTKIPDLGNEPSLFFQSKNPEWTGSLPPGKYNLRIRARDKRRAPGEWSPAEMVMVSLHPVKLLSPSDRSEIKSSEDEMAPVDLTWEAVPGAKEYRVEIQYADRSVQESHTVNSPKLSLRLPVARTFTWTVEAQVSEDLKSEKASSTFTLWGKKLRPPTVNEVKTLGGVTWKNPPHAENFDYQIHRFNPGQNKWEQVKSEKDFKETGVPLENSWIGGEYRLTVKAKARLREISDESQARFVIEDTNRRPASLDTFVLKKNWDRPRGAFVFVQQLVSNMDYKSSNTDNSQQTNFSGPGGSVEIGGGYWSEPDLGGHLSIEMGLLSDGGAKYQFSKTEISGIHRASTEREETRHYFGVFAKEVPMVSSFFETEDLGFISVAGPHYGYEKIYFLTDKYGFLWNAKAYFNLLKMQTPNGEHLVPSLSGRLGLWGRYKIDPATTGFLGYTFRSETVKYRPVSGDSDNSVEFEGHFLNFYVEWDI